MKTQLEYNKCLKSIKEVLRSEHIEDGLPSKIKREIRAYCKAGGSFDDFHNQPIAHVITDFVIAWNQKKIDKLAQTLLKVIRKP